MPLGPFQDQQQVPAIPIDQAQEQENAYVKGSGGCIGLTENPVAFRCWMLSGPELARLLRKFEEEYLPDADPDNPMHFWNHEQGLAAQKTHQKQVNSLFETFKRMGNPFLDDFPELATLDSRNCVDESVSISMHTMEDWAPSSIESLLPKFWKIAQLLFMNQSRRILLLSTSDLN